MDTPLSKRAELFAKRYMSGKRKNSEREAWRHPEDVAKLVDSLPHFAGMERERLIALAWLHDVLEDCEDVEAHTLSSAGIPSPVIADVIALTRRPGVPKEKYLSDLCSARRHVRLIKVLDRIANLREGASTMPTDWIIRYVYQTRTFFVPICRDLPSDVPMLLEHAIDCAIHRRYWKKS